MIGSGSRGSRSTLTALALVAAAACAPTGSGSADPAGPRLVVPRFPADDPLVGTAGFVARTTRVSETVGEVTHTLMVFAVGDVLTLGAMVQGDFEGTAHWRVGGRAFSVPLRRAHRGRTDVPVSGDDAVLPGGRLTGRHGGFDAYDWVNVEVPLRAWLPDGTPVRLAFRGGGREVVVPADGAWLTAEVVGR